MTPERLQTMFMFFFPGCVGVLSRFGYNIAAAGAVDREGRKWAHGGLGGV